MDDRIAALERECADLRRQLAEAQRPAPTPAVDDSAFLAALLAGVPAHVIRADADMRIVYINQRQPGGCPEEVLGHEIREFLHPSSHAAARACITSVLATGLPGGYEALGTEPGEPTHYESVITPLVDPTGRPGICLVAVDVTRLRTYALDLRRSEEELRIAVEATGIGLWQWSPMTNEIYWSARSHEIYGRATPVDMASYIDVLAHPDDRDMLRTNMAGSIAGGPFSGPIHRIIREDGAIRWILARGRTELDANGHPSRMIGGSLDVTQQHELEQQLRHAQRLDAVGHLTAGVAHNFNNMLTVVTGTLEILAMRITDQNRRLIDDAHAAALRAAEMVRQLMTFTGQHAQPDRRPQNIGPLVEQVVDMCRRTFDRHIDLACTIAAHLPAVRCTLTEIEQVVMNLLVNARDAVTDAGNPSPRITITVEPTPEAALRLTISDEGIGMSPDVVTRAFDPFFTTKEVGRGTGLGLTTSYAIVRELHGTMTCVSAPERGTTFVITIPSATPPQALPASTATPPIAARRVLFVDDDEHIRSVITTLLSLADFEVATAASGAAALDHLATGAIPDLILLDRSMPGAPGETFIATIRALAPSVPIVMFTGQSVGPAIAALVDRVIIKPVTGTVLVETIEAVLAEVRAWVIRRSNDHRGRGVRRGIPGRGSRSRAIHVHPEQGSPARRRRGVRSRAGGSLPRLRGDRDPVRGSDGVDSKAPRRSPGFPGAQVLPSCPHDLQRRAAGSRAVPDPSRSLVGLVQRHVLRGATSPRTSPAGCRTS